jgi:hypothetical protein
MGGATAQDVSGLPQPAPTDIAALSVKQPQSSASGPASALPAPSTVPSTL